MEITLRDAVTVLHGMGFGALLLILFSGAAFVVYSTAFAAHDWTDRARRRAGFYFVVMAVLAWAAVLAGAYLVYPWYRAHAPAGATDLTGFPQRLLMASPSTTGWHDIGMEWKEHIAWFAPIGLSAVAYVVLRYGSALSRFRGVRAGVLGMLALAFFSTAVAAGFGAMLNKYAPVRGGPTIVILKAEKHG